MRRGFVGAVVIAAVALAGCSSAPSQGTNPVIKIPDTTQAPLPTPRVEPARIDIEKINAHSSLIPLGLNPDHTLAVPDVTHPEIAAYYCVTDPVRICSSGVLPGQVGPAVIIGHVDGHHRQGVFYHLKDLQVGDVAVVTLRDGTVLDFQVYRVLKAAKTHFPSQVVYQSTDVPEIRLITCTGTFVGGQLGYADNFIAFASLVPNLPGA